MPRPINTMACRLRLVGARLLPTLRDSKIALPTETASAASSVWLVVVGPRTCFSPPGDPHSVKDLFSAGLLETLCELATRLRPHPDAWRESHRSEALGLVHDLDLRGRLTVSEDLACPRTTLSFDFDMLPSRRTLCRLLHRATGLVEEFPLSPCL